MTKSYEQLLGGTVEDRGLDRFKLDQLQTKIFDDLVERAANVELVEEETKLGKLKVELDHNGNIYGSIRRDRYPHSKTFTFSPWSIVQLSEKMKMGGAGYIKKCVTQGFNDLVPTNINRWLEKNNSKEVVLRIHEKTNTLRAIVSDKYGFFDHTDVLGCIKEVLSNGMAGEFKVESAIVTPDNMTLRIVDPKKVVVPGTGNNDGSSIGMSIRNGQTGQMCVSAEFMVYTFFCSNGIFIGADRTMMYSKKHYNVTRETFKEEFLKSIEKFPDYIAAVRNTLELARNISLSSIFDPHSDDGYVFLKKHTGLNAVEMEELLQVYQGSQWDSTVWGLAGAVTQYAQRVGNSARQYQLEQSAGKIVQDGLRLAA